MKSHNIKIGIIILAFSLVITAAFVGLLAVFSQSASAGALTAVPASYGANTYAVTLSEPDTARLFFQGTYTLTPGNLVSIETYQQGYLRSLISRLIPYAVCFCLFLFVLSVGLWLVLRHIQQSGSLRMVNLLNNIEDLEHFSSDDPALEKAYKSLQQKFDDNLQDYKRLNSYLSHEQKNALAILRTQLELTGQREYLADLDALTASIDDVLTLSESQDSTAKATVDVALVCAAVCDSYQAVQRNITFDFDEYAVTEILAKERWIYRAVSNLVSNAVKYGEGKPVVVGVRSANGSVIVTVEDHGIGIEPENQEHIFSHRYRINELNQDGYGIGLSLVSHVCDLCGGFAAVESEPGKGSTFYLSFPQRTGQD